MENVLKALDEKLREKDAEIFYKQYQIDDLNKEVAKLRKQIEALTGAAK